MTSYLNVFLCLYKKFWADFKDKVATFLKKKNKYNQTVYGRVRKLNNSKA